MSAGREHPGMMRIGVTYVCEKCAAGAELRRAIEANDAERARFIATHAPRAHGDGCERANAPMFSTSDA